MRKLYLCGAALAGLGVAGCAHVPPRPVAYVAPPPPGQRRCVEFREDMFGRRYCSRFVGT